MKDDLNFNYPKYHTVLLAFSLEICRLTLKSLRWYFGLGMNSMQFLKGRKGTNNIFTIQFLVSYYLMFQIENKIKN